MATRASELQVPKSSTLPTLDKKGKNRKEDCVSLDNFSRTTIASSRQGHHLSTKSTGFAKATMERLSAESPKLTTPKKNTASKGVDVLNKISTPEIYSSVRFDTPRRNAAEQIGAGVEKSNLVVAVRVRPQNSKEKLEEEMNQVVLIKDSEISVLTDHGQTHTFNYDHCFSSNPGHKQHSDQQKVYETLARPLLTKAFEGYNTCLFAYGQTGSGKSYSVMGSTGTENELHESAGIVPRFCYELFQKAETMLTSSVEDSTIHVQISYFEIYKEKILDLLSPVKAAPGGLRVREHPQTVSRKNFKFFFLELRGNAMRYLSCRVPMWLICHSMQ